MLDLLSTVAKDLAQRQKSKSGAKTHPTAQMPDQQGFYAQLGVNRGRRSLPEWRGWELSNPLQVLLAVAMSVFGNKNKHSIPKPIDPAPRYMHDIYYSSDKPDLQVPKRDATNPTPIGSVFLIHALTSVGHDCIGLAASLGNAGLTASVFGDNGVDIDIALPNRLWQEQNHSAKTILQYNFSLEGNPITAGDIRSGLDRSLVIRRRFYESIGMHVKVHGPGQTGGEASQNEELLDEGMLRTLVDELCSLSIRLSGRVLTDEQRQDPRIAFLEHLDTTASGRKDNKMRSVDSNRIYYYLLQAFVQGYYLNKEKMIFKLGPPSEVSFDESNNWELNPGGSGLPGTAGSFARYYHPHRQVAGRTMLDYHWFSLDIRETALRNGRSADLTDLMMNAIPLSRTSQEVSDIAALLKATPLMSLNHLLADLIGAALSFNRRQPDTFRDACGAAGLAGGLEDLLHQLGGDTLVEGWHEATELPPGKPTRDRWLNWFDAFDPKAGPQGSTPPHLWFALQSHWQDNWQYGRLAQLLDVFRNYYQAVTAG